MHTLHVSVNNKVVTYSARDGSIVCGNDDYQVQFALDSEWDGLPAKARFIWNGKHEDAPIVDGIAAVPVIVRAHEVKVGVYAEDESIQTTTAARIPCDRSVLCDVTKPTEGNEAYYASAAQEAAQRAENAAERAEAAGGTSGGGTGEPGVAGKNGATFTPSVADDGTLSWTNDGGLPNPEPVNITGPKGDPYELTETDKQAIVANVLAALPASEEVAV